MITFASIAGCTHTRPFETADGRLVPGSIATMEMPTLGGVAQSVWFRGVDVARPAVILLHGGPGVSESALFRHFDAELERNFLMVYWEQRGTGRSFHSAATRESMTIDRLYGDLDELVDLVRARFNKRSVILLAHSWGTVLGTRYAYEHPDKVAAYVGIGQIAKFSEDERVSYDWAVARATERNDKSALRRLQQMAPAPASVDDELVKGRIVEAFGGVFHGKLSTWKLVTAALCTDEASLVDLVKFGRGNRFSLESLRGEYSKVDLTQYRVFRTPIFFALGRYDWHVPSVLAERYFETIDAPVKQLRWFEQSAHNPPFEEPQAFVRFMVDEVLPRAAASAPRESTRSTARSAPQL